MFTRLGLYYVQQNTALLCITKNKVFEQKYCAFYTVTFTNVSRSAVVGCRSGFTFICPIAIAHSM